MTSLCHEKDPQNQTCTDSRFRTKHVFIPEDTENWANLIELNLTFLLTVALIFWTFHNFSIKAMFISHRTISVLVSRITESLTISFTFIITRTVSWPRTPARQVYLEMMRKIDFDKLLCMIYKKTTKQGTEQVLKCWVKNSKEPHIYNAWSPLMKTLDVVYI